MFDCRDSCGTCTLRLPGTQNPAVGSVALNPCMGLMGLCTSSTEIPETFTSVRVSSVRPVHNFHPPARTRLTRGATYSTPHSAFFACGATSHPRPGLRKFLVLTSLFALRLLTLRTSRTKTKGVYPSHNLSGFV
jgi:hypothetical protein